MIFGSSTIMKLVPYLDWRAECDGGNVRNDGLIDNLPQGCSTVSAGSDTQSLVWLMLMAFSRTKAGTLPFAFLAALMQTNINARR